MPNALASGVLILLCLIAFICLLTLGVGGLMYAVVVAELEAAKQPRKGRR